MSKKSKREARENKILVLWQTYIENNPDFLTEYNRLIAWYSVSWNWRNRWFYENYNNQIYPYISQHAQNLAGSYSLKEKIDVFRKFYDEE